MVYMGLTLDSVAEICWGIFKEFDENFKLALRFNEHKKIINFPNGSRIRLFGLDSSKKEIKKILGSKLRKCTIDESGSISTGLEEIVKQMINPALIDLKPFSWLSLIGTAENIPATYYEKVCEGLDLELPWSIHKWTASDNPYMKKNWEEEIGEMIARNPEVVNASWFKTHYLNFWAVCDDLAVYAYSRELHSCKPFEMDKNWFYSIGVDLGYNDDTAFAVVAYSPYSRFGYLVKSGGKSGMDFTDTANMIKEIQKIYPSSMVVVDGANKQGVEEMKNRLGLPNLETAEKSGKVEYIRLMRDDLYTGYLKVFESGNEDWESEASKLQWADKLRIKENPNQPNHKCDSALYAWRACKNYIGEPLAPAPSPHSHEAMIEQEKREAEQIEQDINEDYEYDY